MSPARLLTAIAFLGLLGFYLFNAGQLTDEVGWGSVAMLALLGFIFIKLGSSSKPNVNQAIPMQSVQEIETVAEEDEANPDIPAPVVNEDVTTLAERKRAKVEAAKAAAAQAMAESEDDDEDETPLGRCPS